MHSFMVAIHRGAAVNVIIQIFLDVGKFELFATNLFDANIYGDYESTPKMWLAVGYESYILFQQMGSLFYI